MILFQGGWVFFYNNDDFPLKKDKIEHIFCVTILKSFYDLIKVKTEFPDLVLHCFKYNVACKKDLHQIMYC